MREDVPRELPQSMPTPQPDGASLLRDLTQRALRVPPRDMTRTSSVTQAALLSGFAYNGIIQVDIPTDSSDWLKTLYLCVTTSAMGFELIAVLNSTLCSMLGPGLALRGPDGSMHRAVDGLMLEYR